MSVDMMDQKVKELRKLRRMQEELAAEIEAIQDELKAHMDTHGMDTLLGFDWRITWKAVTSKRLDTGALRKAMPDVAQAFTRETTTKRFVLA
jgi:predicted phage-related endonuclease